MQILVATHHLDQYGGSETYVYTLSKGLKSAGHEVFIYTRVAGKVADKIRENGIYVSDNIKDLVKIGGFDVIHAQHNITTIEARQHFPYTPMILMVHGIVPDLEQPPSIDLGIRKIVAISNGVKNHLQQTYGLDNIEIIHNPIDTNRYYSKKNINQTIKHVLVISNHFPENEKQLLNKVCSHCKLDLSFVGLPCNPVWNIEDYINEADLVISLGRGILESMACGRAVMVHDMHGSDGLLTEELFWLSMENNCSGRKFASKLDFEGVINEFSKYHSKMGEINRGIILNHFTIEKHVEQMLGIYEAEIEHS
jgi:O-antigen biosynthesis protein